MKYYVGPKRNAKCGCIGNGARARWHLQGQKEGTNLEGECRVRVLSEKFAREGRGPPRTQGYEREPTVISERLTTSSIHTSCSQDLKSHVRHGYEVPHEPECAVT